MSNIYKKALTVWNKLEPKNAISSFVREIDLHKNFINFFQPGPTYHFVFDIETVEFEFISDEILDILGYNPNEFNIYTFLNKIHPDDQPYVMAFEEKIKSFLQKLTSENLIKYKFQYTFRILDNWGNYKTILQQIITLQYNSEKDTAKSLGFHSDISHLNLEGKPSLSILGLNGEPSYFNISVDDNSLIPAKEMFTAREKEIIKLIAEGYKSSQIAEMLFISKHTVGTHRKNILGKTNCRTWIEAASKAMKNGWM